MPSLEAYGTALPGGAGVTTRLSTTGALILPAYLLVTVGLGWLSRRPARNANALLNASRSLPLPVVAASFLAVNCGALEIIGLSAMAAQYGVEAFHFYWIGAIPALIFLSGWMLPVYLRTRARSMPEYLAARFGLRVRVMHAALVAAVMLMLAGINLYAMAQVLLSVFRVPFFVGVLGSGMAVLVYVLLGGIRATMYTGVFQLVVMLAGLLPLSFHTFGLLQGHSGASRLHLWRDLPGFSHHAHLDRFGVVVGLGFTLSFSYWCTDFVLMQRALAARSEADARQVPLWAGLGKVLFSFLVVGPALVAPQLLPALGHTQRYDQTLPRLMTLFYGPTMLGLGLTALFSSLAAGLAANVSGFSAAWTVDLYQTWLAPGRSEVHYLRVGKLAALAAVLIGLATSFVSFFFSNLMDHVQLLFSLTSAPFWAIFLLSLSPHRPRPRGALAALGCGVGLGLIHHLAVYEHLLSYGSVMNANMHVAIYAFACTLLVGWACRSHTPAPEMQPGQLPRSSPFRASRQQITSLALLSAVLLAVCIVCNVLWW